MKKARKPKDHFATKDGLNVMFHIWGIRDLKKLRTAINNYLKYWDPK